MSHQSESSTQTPTVNFEQVMRRVTKYSAGEKEELHLIAREGQKASYSRAQHGGGLLQFEIRDGKIYEVDM